MTAWSEKSGLPKKATEDGNSEYQSSLTRLLSSFLASGADLRLFHHVKVVPLKFRSSKLASRRQRLKSLILLSMFRVGINECSKGSLIWLKSLTINHGFVSIPCDAERADISDKRRPRSAGSFEA
ncbi:hypothetical protein Bca52824_078155 [Brassica carinata]|uniref:Uncharacterized protein n=1 Tax=Brassica carinata TaxID=52824 RepID=A0A8X7U0Q0_BRACI|nr:hypothetical protein Bca52824_078155 [Brassica carinata]